MKWNLAMRKVWLDYYFTIKFTCVPSIKSPQKVLYIGLQVPICDIHQNSGRRGGLHSRNRCLVFVYWISYIFSVARGGDNHQPSPSIHVVDAYKSYLGLVPMQIYQLIFITFVFFYFTFAVNSKLYRLLAVPYSFLCQYVDLSPDKRCLVGLLSTSAPNPCFLYWRIFIQIRPL